MVGRFPNETSALVMVFSLLNEERLKWQKVKRWLLEEGFLRSTGWIRQKFLHLANGKKNIGKQIEGKQGLSGVIRFKGYGKWIEPPVTIR